MPELPYKQGAEEGVQPRYCVIPDNVHGGWLVYATNDPQEPQAHFDNKEDAIGHAERVSRAEGVGFIVEEYEAPERGV